MATSQYNISEYGIAEYGLVTFDLTTSQAQSSTENVSVFFVESSGEAQQALGDFEVKATNLTSSQAQGNALVGRVGSLLIWDGADWVVPVLKYWDGSAWVATTLKHWNGTQWL